MQAELREYVHVQPINQLKLEDTEKTVDSNYSKEPYRVS